MSVQTNPQKRSLGNGDTPCPEKIPRLDFTDMGKSPISVLYETVGVNNIEFIELSVSGPSHAPQFVVECSPVRDHSSDILNLLSDSVRFQGIGNSKQKAKQEAASMMLQTLIRCNPCLLQSKSSFSNSNLKVDGFSGPGYTSLQPQRKNRSSAGLKNLATADDIKSLLSKGAKASAASILNSLRPDLEYVVTEETIDDKTRRFVCNVDINGNKIRGDGQRKQSAKQNAAMAVLRSVYQIDYESLTSHDSSQTESEEKEEYSLDDSTDMPLNTNFADNFQFMVKDQFKEICNSISKEFSARKVLAGIMITRPAEKTPDGYESRILCVTTGTKGLNGKHLSLNGDVINDCHAEILARRCLQRYLYRQILYLLGEVSAEQFGDEWVILKRVPDKPLFDLVEGVKFHLYISSAPCGDARIFIHQVNDTVRDDHPNRRNKALLRTKIESGEGTIPNQSETGIQTWDGIINGERLLTMSCSDKICMWNCLGLQGALLSHLLTQPLYLYSLVLGSLYNRAHLKRALCDRAAKLEFPETAVERGFRVVCPNFYVASSQDERTPAKSPNFGINWISNDCNVEVITTDKGRTIKGETSRLSKRYMMDLFLKVNRSLEDIPTAYSQYTYAQLKEKLDGSSTYMESKKQFVKHFKNNDLGVWVTKPFELENFDMN